MKIGGIVMRQFSLDEYLKNPNRRIVTGKGNPVRIICTNANSAYCVIGLVCLPNKEEVAVSYYANGTRWFESKAEPDLFFVTEKKEGWINLYKNSINRTYLRTSVFKTKEEAEKYRRANDGSIATIKIEWEE